MNKCLQKKYCLNWISVLVLVQYEVSGNYCLKIEVRVFFKTFKFLQRPGMNHLPFKTDVASDMEMNKCMWWTLVFFARNSKAFFHSLFTGHR